MTPIRVTIEHYPVNRPIPQASKKAVREAFGEDACNEYKGVITKDVTIYSGRPELILAEIRGAIRDGESFGYVSKGKIIMLYWSNH